MQYVPEFLRQEGTLMVRYQISQSARWHKGMAMRLGRPVWVVESVVRRGRDDDAFLRNLGHHMVAQVEISS